MAAIQQPCRYSGILNLYLRTYTQAYPNASTFWKFNSASLYPMEYTPYQIGGGIGVPVGFKARMIDFLTGYSFLSAGNVGAAFQSNITNLVYNIFNGRVEGFFDGGATRNPMFVSEALPIDGQSRTITQFSQQSFAKLFPTATGQIPAGFSGVNGLTTSGIYASKTYIPGPSAVIVDTGFTDGHAGYTDTLFSQSGLTFNSQGAFQISLPRPDDVFFYPSKGVNYIMTSTGGGGNVPYNVIATDYTLASVYLQAIADSPPLSSIDFGAYFASAVKQGNFSSYKNGWLALDVQTLTIGALTLKGFGLLVAPDFSSYLIINFLPLDTLAANWWNHSSASAKVDQSGYMFVKNTNVDKVLFVTQRIPQISMFPGQIGPLNLPQTLGLYR